VADLAPAVDYPALNSIADDLALAVGDLELAVAW